MSERRVSILEGNTFVVSDERGDIAATPADTGGLFHQDTRFLSTWRLTVNGERLNPLSTDDVQYFRAQFFLVPGTGTIYVDSDLSVVRRRSVGCGFHEDVTVMNHGAAPVELVVRIEADADFADLFEVKDALVKKGERYRRIEGDRLILGYRRERFVRETSIQATNGVTFDDRGLLWRIRLEPQSERSTCIEVVAATDVLGARNTHTKYGHEATQGEPAGESLERWRAGAPTLVASSAALSRAYERSLVDLAALRFFPQMLSGGAVPAAGLPWFMAVFGRDSLITSLQALPFLPQLAESTLRVLALRQGTRRDDFRDEEPGKILHESRLGELTAFEERPHSPYFGSADATPLFLILLDEYERWSGNVDLVRALEPNARAALAWIDAYGDRDGDGYVDYETRNPETGLANQCWKDSGNAIQYSDGTIAGFPRATCEIQGYVYDAKVRGARLARAVWGDAALAARLEREAAALKARFNRDFWIPERNIFALAIDGSTGARVDVLTSNVGHLLWSGIVDAVRAPLVVQSLMDDRLFSGWGVRTMATDERGYNPVGYHVGTVWPHDNSLIAWGLWRYGFRDEASRVAMGILDAAPYFHDRLPEAFAGYERSSTRFPVEYPTACSPQAWASGAPLLFLRVLLGLEPMGEHLLVDPHLPPELERIELLDVPGRWKRADAFGRARRLAG